MKVKKTITSKLTYSDVEVISQSEGIILLSAKKSDNGSKVAIHGLRIDSQSLKRSLLAKDKKTFSVAQHQYLQKYTEKPFLSAIDSENAESLYYLMPVRHIKSTLLSSLDSFTPQERLQIAYKLAKGVEYLHCQADVYHGNLEPSAIFVKKQDEETGFLVKIPPPFPPKMLKASFSRKELSVYRIASEETSKKSDIWTLGLIFYQLFTGKQLPDKEKVKDHPQILDHFQFGLDIKSIKDLNIEKLIKSMLSREVERRVSIQDVTFILKKEVLQSLYGRQYTIPLIQQQKECQRDNQKEIIIPKINNTFSQGRIVLKHLILVIKLSEGIKMSLSLHYRQNFQSFLSITYCFTELPEVIQKDFKRLDKLVQQLCKKDKKSIRFSTNGALTFYHKQG